MRRLFRCLRPTRSFSFLATCAIAFLTLAPAAFAATSYTNPTPAAGTTTALTKPQIKVTATDPAGLNASSLIMKINGVKVNGRMSGSTVSFTPTTALANGVQAVSVSLLNWAGVRSTYNWSFSVGAKPVIGPMTPADGTTIATDKPAISALVTTYGSGLSSFAMTVDGVSVDASYDPVTKMVSFTPSTGLRNDASHTVVLSVNDAYGQTASVTWSFSVQIYADMVSSMGCVECHFGYPALHSMDNCDNCHGYSGPIGGFYGPPDYHPAGEAAQLLQNCTYCHTGGYPTVPVHTDLRVAHSTTRDMTGCACHVRSLTIEHNRWIGQTGSSLTCASCHGDSASVAVKEALAAGITDCEGCHPGAAAHSTAHETAVSPTCAGSGCHTGDALTNVHKGTCESCHDSEDPRVVAAIAGGVKACDACHNAEAPHPGMAVTHTASMGPASVTVFQYHEDLGDRADMYMECKLCHSANIAKVHANNCATCHAEGGPLGSFTTWEKGCQQGDCHPSYHDDAGAIHVGADGGSCRCHGPNWYATPSDCTQCHTFLDEDAPVTTSNARSAVRWRRQDHTVGR